MSDELCVFKTSSRSSLITHHSSLITDISRRSPHSARHAGCANGSRLTSLSAAIPERSARDRSAAFSVVVHSELSHFAHSAQGVGRQVPTHLDSKCLAPSLHHSPSN